MRNARPRFQLDCLRAPLRFRGSQRTVLLVVSALILLFVLLVLGAVVSEYQARLPDRTVTSGKFAEIGRGLRNYSDEMALHAYERSHPRNPDGGLSLDRVPWGTGRLPSPVVSRNARSGESPSPKGEGKRPFTCSWRYTIFPLLIGVGKLLQYEEPWDAPVNQSVVNEYGAFFCLGRGRSDGPIRDTIALAVTGPGTAFGDGKEPPMPLNEVPAAAILVVEVRASGIPWPAAGDLDIRTMPRTINAPDGKGISGQHEGGFHVIFADQQVWFISDKVPFETIQRFFTVADAMKSDRERLLGPYALGR
jgi:hypothetical protein